MKIILTQNVPNLGFVGDEVAVKDGYARNFLLPRGMALPLSGKNARIIQHRRVQLDKERAEAIAEARGEAEKVSAAELVLKARAGTGGRLFGSITNRDLQAALAEQGVELDRKAIVLHAPVKSLGHFTATVRIHTDVKVELNFKVEASEIVAPEHTGEEAEAGETADVEGETTAEVTAEDTAEVTDEAAAREGAAAPEAAAPEGAADSPAEGEAAPADEPPAS